MAILERASWPEMHCPVSLMILALNSGQALKEAWQLVGNRSSEGRGGSKREGWELWRRIEAKKELKAGDRWYEAV